MNVGGRIRGRARIALTLTLAMIATLLVSVAAPPTGTVHAVPAPTAPLPLCAVDDDGNEGLGCIPGSRASIATGTFATGSTFVVDAGKIGLSACAWYTATGCYYTVFTPSLVRCVYLHDGDPGDVRSCSGSLSTEGSLSSYSAQRQGSCSGTLGSTYAQGGPSNGDPSTWWTSRGPIAARCEYQVPNTYDIDNLSGPTFILVRASVNECIEPGGGYGCDESWATLERRTAYAWLPVEGDLAPRADFTAEGSSTSGRFDFVNESIPFGTGTTTYEWTFGDGGTSTATSPSHRYTEAGEYTVRLTMRSSTGASRSHTETVDLDSPDLVVSVWNPDAEFGPGKSGNRFNVGDEFTVAVKVKATEGVGELSDVAPVGGLLQLPEQLELVDDPLVVEPAPMGEYDERAFEVEVRAKAAGRFTVRSDWTATDDADRTKTGDGEFNGNVTGLKVEITPDRPSYSLDEDFNEDGEITPEDNDVTFTVKVTNVSNAPITDITKGPIELTSRAEDNPAVRLFLQTSPVDDFPDLAPNESAELEWVYRADDAVNADVSTLITAAQGSATITGLGEEVVQVFTSKLLEARIDVDNAQPFTSGRIITISGNFKNVSDTTDQERSLSFQVGRALGGAFSPGVGTANAGNAFFTTPGGATPEGMDAFRLEPGDDIDLDAIVQTMRSPEPSGFNVSFRVYVNAIKLDDEGNAVLKEDGTPEWEHVDEMLVEVVEESGFSREHDVTLAPVPAETEATNFVNCAESLLLTFYTGCKLVRGLETMLRGLWGLGELAVDVAVANVQMNIWLMRTYFEFLTTDAAGRKALVDEVIADIRELAAAGHRIATNIDLGELATAVPKFIDNTITRIHGVLQTGDMKLIVGELAELAGENIDMVIEGLVAARTLAKVAKAAAGTPGPIRTNLQRTWAQRRDKGLEDLDRIIATKGHEAVPESRVLPAGVDVTDLPKVWRDSYGIHEDDLQNLLKIAEDEGVSITFRSRAPESADLIRSGRALPKPQGIKTKGVNDIDIEYLGYKAEWKAKVYVAEPPVPYFPEGPARDQAIANWIKDNPKLNGAPKDVRDAVTARLHTRLDEWPEMLEKMKDWKSEGVFVDFDPGFNGFPEGILHQKPNLDARLTRDDLGGGRKAWRVQMKAPADAPPHPDGDVFRDITGDIDFLAILTLDGKILGANGNAAELAKRGRIYEKMRALVGMQHGESFSIVTQKHFTKYVKDGVDGPGGETLLAATPNGRLLTTYFDDTLSTLKGGPNSQLGELAQGRAFFGSVFSELRSPNRGFDAITLEQLFRLHRSFKQRVLRPFTISALARLIAFLAPEDVAPEMSRDGDILAPDEDGNLVTYGDGPDGEPRGGVASDSLVRAPQVETDDAAIDEELAIVTAAGYDATPEPGALGGVWTPVDVGALIADGPITLAPFTYVGEHTPAGSTEVPVLSLAELSVPSTSAFFEVGDRVVVDPGGSAEEFATVASVAPFRLSKPLVGDHELGTMIVLHPDSLGAVGSLHPITPVRLVETRVGQDTVDGVAEGIGRLEAGSVTTVQIAGRGGVDADAAAVALNVTAIRPAGPGYVTLFPCGEDQPLTSSLNYAAGAVAGNSGIVKLDGEGRLCIFTFAETDLVIDATGWLAEADDFSPLVSARLAETRAGQATVDGEEQDLGRLAGGSTTELTIAGRGGVDVGADAVALNVTAINPSAAGFVTLFPCDGEQPLTSSLNYAPGDVKGNSAVVSLSDTGTLCVFSFAETDLVIDVNAALNETGSFAALVPGRVLETRAGQETVDGVAAGVGRVGAGEVVEVDIAGRADVGSAATAVAVNTTAINPAGAGYVTLFPCDGEQPLTSSLNYGVGGVAGNSAIVKLAADGSLCAFSFADTDLVVDVTAAWVG